MGEKETSTDTKVQFSEGTENKSNLDSVEIQFAAKKKKRLDPTRYGDWEKDGRCIDF